MCCFTGDDKGPEERLSNDVETNTCKNFNIQKLKTIRAFDATTDRRIIILIVITCIAYKIKLLKFYSDVCLKKKKAYASRFFFFFYMTPIISEKQFLFYIYKFHIISTIHSKTIFFFYIYIIIS